MERTLIIFGLILCLDALFNKLGVWDKIEFAGARSKVKLLTDLANCRFCCFFHMAWILTIVFCLVFGYDSTAWITPFAVYGLMTLKK